MSQLEPSPDANQAANQSAQQRLKRQRSRTPERGDPAAHERTDREKEVNQKFAIHTGRISGNQEVGAITTLVRGKDIHMPEAGSEQNLQEDFVVLEFNY